MISLIIGLGIFIAVFYCIITEKIPGAWATMLGGLAMAMVGIFNEEEALHAIASRLEILFLLIGMMIIVHLISETGVFQWFAITLAKFVKGEPFLLIVFLAIVTAVCSAFLDNVTTILLMAPISILLAGELRLNPFPFVITEIMAANIGGNATLIGDPTQLIIGHESGLGFNEFLFNTSPVAIISMVILLLNVYFIYGRDFKVSNELKARIMEMNPGRSLKDKKLLKEAGIIFSLVILGFVLNNFINKGLAIISLSGAFLLVTMAKKKPADIFKHVEWDTLFFFIGLFMMVLGIEKIHVIDIVSDKMIALTKGNFEFATMSIMTLSALFTSVIGNVANAATISKIIDVMAPTFKGMDTSALWWALSFGSCLGGNITILGSATNVVAVGVAAKSGCKIDFVKFLKFGALIAVQTLVLAGIYLKLRYM
ncbi:MULTISPECIES: ArsB/NhaD family transporter [Cetobacterium]|jgi:Na+/H+ antiporter NhaD/arsenite permease-like protein|uniref:ArsB/NhaD family transporter n=1 Tax=Candidatus Cetobacterium colombiensis TaxID=3073100 RepID=A0ABU4WAB7_9FUSO|nr:ArsB/NhaD family transporter [Candidatus Cetobacterium colombiensis]MDX8335962.1 ArsB/NhaD family transporter [Candidatus Cetobacterium colombiensis]